MQNQRVYVLCENTTLGMEYIARKVQISPLNPGLHFINTLEGMQGYREVLYINAIAWQGPYGRQMLQRALAAEWFDITHWNVGTIRELIQDTALIQYAIEAIKNNAELQSPSRNEF